MIRSFISVNFRNKSDDLLEEQVAKNLLDWSESGIALRLNFLNPMLVSQGYVDDILEIKVRKSVFQKVDMDLALPYVDRYATTNSKRRNLD